MNKIILIGMLGVLIGSIIGSTPASAVFDKDFYAVMGGFGTEPVTDQQWLKCARKAVEAGEKEMRAEGIESNFWGMAGTGMITAATEKCGYVDSPKTIPKWAIGQINEECYEAPDAVDYEIFKRPFYKYHPDYLKKTIMTECKKVYNSKAGTAKRNAERSAEDARRRKRDAEEQAKSAATGIKIVRVYSPVNGITTAVIETNRDRRVKCAALSSTDEYLSVRDTVITAPVDEVSLFVDAYSVKCWPR
jgi:hypothetical protein